MIVIFVAHYIFRSYSFYILPIVKISTILPTFPFFLHPCQSLETTFLFSIWLKKKKKKQILHMIGTMQCLSFSLWLILLSMMHSRFIHVL